LSQASFAFADLRGASFNKADLTGAIFFAADLRGATFDGATINQTEFTGSFIRSDALSPQQKKGACRQPLPTVPGKGQFAYVIKVIAIEPIPNSRYDKGIEYSPFNESEHLFRLEPTEFNPCEPRKLPDSKWLPLWQHQGKEHLKREIGFRIGHDFLQQSGRRVEIPSWISKHLEWLYPFPKGKYMAIPEGAAPPSPLSIKTSQWALDFREDETVLFSGPNSESFSVQYSREPNYEVSLVGKSGSLGCTETPAEYRWYYIEEGHLRLSSDHPDDRCVHRKSLLESHWWVPLGKGK
jgi:hypothetical protein